MAPRATRRAGFCPACRWAPARRPPGSLWCSPRLPSAPLPLPLHHSHPRPQALNFPPRRTCPRRHPHLGTKRRGFKHDYELLLSWQGFLFSFTQKNLKDYFNVWEQACICCITGGRSVSRKTYMISINGYMYQKVERKWVRMTKRWTISDKFVTSYRGSKLVKIHPADTAFKTDVFSISANKNREVTCLFIYVFWEGKGGKKGGGEGRGGQGISRGGGGGGRGLRGRERRGDTREGEEGTKNLQGLTGRRHSVWRRDGRLLFVLLELGADLLLGFGDDQLLEAVLERDVEQAELAGQLPPVQRLAGALWANDQQSDGRRLQKASTSVNLYSYALSSLSMQAPR